MMKNIISHRLINVGGNCKVIIKCSTLLQQYKVNSI